MIERYLLQIFGIISIGDYTFSFFKNKFNKELKIDYIDRFLISVIIGYSILLLPMVFIGVLFNGYMQYVAYIYYSLSLISLLFYLIKLSKIASKIYYVKTKITDMEKILILFIVLILTGYTFILLIYYERGWDALHFYFPNAIYFYLSDGIPAGYNPLSFYPTFKPPVNTLLITYSQYINGGGIHHTYANLHALVMIAATTGIVYEIVKRIYNDRNLSLLASIVFLLTPLTYMLVYEYAYYQDIYVMFFMSATFYFLYINNNNSKILILIASLSSMLAILSKLSGYTIFFLVIITFNFKPFNNKFIKILITSTVYLFLVYYTAFNIFIGYSIVIIFLLITTIHYIINNTNTTNFSFISTITFFIFPLLVSIFWIWFMWKIPGISGFLKNTYIAKKHSSIQFNFIPIQDKYTTYPDNGMGISFASSMFYVITGMQMGMTTGLFRIIGFFRNNRFINGKIFMITFFTIWFGYYGRVSARYLTPILPFFSVFTLLGIIELLNLMKLNYNLTISRVIFIITTTVVSIYPFIPFEFLSLQDNVRMYMYYKLITHTILYFIIISLLFILLLKTKVKPKKFHTKITLLYVIVFSLLMFSPQLYYYQEAGFDKEKFNTSILYVHRPAYNELIEEIKSLDLEITDIILSVNTPGLEYFTGHSVLDLMYISDYTRNTQLNSNDSEVVFNFMVKYNIKIIIKLNKDHVYYQAFVRKYDTMTLFSIVKNDTNFLQIYNNSEFIVFNRINNGNYSV